MILLTFQLNVHIYDGKLLFDELQKYACSLCEDDGSGGSSNV